MPAIDSFATKRGTARFDDGELRFEESVVGYVRSLYRNYWRAGEWWRRAVFVGYVLALLFAAGWLVTAVVRGDAYLLAALVAAIVVLRGADYARGFRSSDRIALDAIEAVSATRGEKGLTRPRFVLTYVDGGTAHRRRVNMPSLYTEEGERAFERARTAFEERGFETGRSARTDE